MPVVYEGSEPIDFGRPCFWKTGIAERVLKKELRVETVEIHGLEKEKELHDDVESTTFTCVHSQALGAKTDQEDRFICKEVVEGISDLSFFGVYDGHGGAQTAQYLSEHLHLNFAEALQRSAQIACAQTTIDSTDCV